MNKSLIPIMACLVLASTLLPLSLFATSTINATNRYAWGANIGWQDWRADGANGVVIGQFVCSGYIYAANVGWIHLGDGSPADGVQYQNNSATDYGVNHEGDGRLRGFAYGANIGWVQFEDLGDPRVNLLNGELSGYAYGANVGWINLNTAEPDGLVQADTMEPGLDTDGDGIPDAWEIVFFGGPTNANASAMASNNVNTLLEAYIAGLDPHSTNDFLEITAIDHLTVPDRKEITWSSKETRVYRLDGSTNLLEATDWIETDPPGQILPDPGTHTMRSVDDDAIDFRNFRVRVSVPLGP